MSNPNQAPQPLRAMARGLAPIALLGATLAPHSADMTAPPHQDVIDNEARGWAADVPETHVVDIAMPRSPKFAEGPEANQFVDPSQVAQVGTVIRDLEAHGHRVTEVVARGKASDENRSKGWADADLGKGSPENEELAKERGDTIERATELTLASQGITRDVQNGPDIEHLLTTPAEIQQVDGYVQQLGFDSRGALLQAHADGKLGGPIKDEMDRMFTEHRGGQIAITSVADRDSQPPAPVGGPLIPGTERPDQPTDDDTDPDLYHPIVIPIPGRTSDEKPNEPIAGDNPPEPAPPLVPVADRKATSPATLPLPLKKDAPALPGKTYNHKQHAGLRKGAYNQGSNNPASHIKQPRPYSGTRRPEASGVGAGGKKGPMGRDSGGSRRYKRG